MSDDDPEWIAHRNKVIMTAFMTGRPVISDSAGVMKYADTGEPVDTEVVRGDASKPFDPDRMVLAMPKASVRRAGWFRRLWHRIF